MHCTYSQPSNDLRESSQTQLKINVKCNVVLFTYKIHCYIYTTYVFLYLLFRLLWLGWYIVLCVFVSIAINAEMAINYKLCILIIKTMI